MPETRSVVPAAPQHPRAPQAPQPLRPLPLPRPLPLGLEWPSRRTLPLSKAGFPSRAGPAAHARSPRPEAGPGLLGPQGRVVGGC